ncbi:MAG: hypothetical protein NC235_03010 [Clostridiales bacterium]|nr:hypothetical protein [Clostridiales bacterium]MCM1434918.1 hypothetical protein [Ruminococcus flavefaciens]
MPRTASITRHPYLPDCEVKFYGREHGQLCDSEGYAVIDADGARIYICK